MPTSRSGASLPQGHPNPSQVLGCAPTMSDMDLATPSPSYGQISMRREEEEEDEEERKRKRKRETEEKEKEEDKEEDKEEEQKKRKIKRRGSERGREREGEEEEKEEEPNLPPQPSGGTRAGAQPTPWAIHTSLQVKLCSPPSCGCWLFRMVPKRGGWSTLNCTSRAAK